MDYDEVARRGNALYDAVASGAAERAGEALAGLSLPEADKVRDVARKRNDDERNAAIASASEQAKDGSALPLDLSVFDNRDVFFQRRGVS